ncbi:IS200/IS605 family accessory protein TnpB-related protein [Nocardia sp. NPDC050799]|uniref:IS200/IS605 family accessory protein TnpB-related protein n=1 Tax=Nocardia sp. NPDC050799 TaxID=3154842 RepID=UPI0033F6F68E
MPCHGRWYAVFATKRGIDSGGGAAVVGNGVSGLGGIAIEDLRVRNMTRNRKSARAISDASWSRFRSMLECKAGWYGRSVVAVDRSRPAEMV